jgi:hypothetical protein
LEEIQRFDPQSVADRHEGVESQVLVAALNPLGEVRADVQALSELILREPSEPAQLPHTEAHVHPNAGR